MMQSLHILQIYITNITYITYITNIYIQINTLAKTFLMIKKLKS